METLLVKDWFVNKKAQEMKRNFDKAEVFAIIGESEKAVNVFIGSDRYGCAAFWTPKSCTETKEADCANHATRHCNSFAEAKEQWNLMMSDYR